MCDRCHLQVFRVPPELILCATMPPCAYVGESSIIYMCMRTAIFTLYRSMIGFSIPHTVPDICTTISKSEHLKTGNVAEMFFFAGVVLSMTSAHSQKLKALQDQLTF